MLKLRGVFVAIVTPFRMEGGKLSIDYDTLASLIEFHVKAGTTGIVVGGCTGESFTLSIEEQMNLIRFVIKQAAGRLLVIPGTGSNNTDEAIALTRCAADAKADCAMVITSYANKPMPSGQIAHIKAIIEATGGRVPIMLYDVPGRTAIKMLPETVACLFKECEQVVALKAASGDLGQVSQILNMCDITILSGDDGLTIPMMAAGAKGVVSVTANIIPELMVKAIEPMPNAKIAEAAILHQGLYALHQAMFLETNPMPVKAAMRMMGLIPDASCRLPLGLIEQTTEDKLRQILIDQGFLEA